MSTRPRRTRRPRTDNPPPGRLLLSGGVVAAVIALFVWIGVSAQNGVPTRSYREVDAVLPDIGNLKVHDDVRIAGTRVGQVIRTSTTGSAARVRLQLQGDLVTLPSDTTAQVRGRGLLGTRFLELVPGRSSRPLAKGAAVRSAELSVTNGVPDVLNTFDKETRGHLGQTVRGLGASLAGNGDAINETIGRAPELADDLRVVAGAVLARPAAARSLLPDLDAGVTALDGAREDIALGLRPTADGLRPFAAAREDIHRTLDQAPSTLDTARTALVPGEALLASVRKLSDAVDLTLPGAPAGLRRAAKVLRTSGTGLQNTADLLQTARPAVPDILKITSAVRPQLKPLRDTFTTSRPLVDRLGEHSCDVQAFAANWRSALGYGTPSHNDNGGGDLGELGQFRIQLISGPNAASSLRPDVVPFTDLDYYTRPCRDVGQRWTRLGIDNGKAP